MALLPGEFDTRLAKVWQQSCVEVRHREILREVRILRT